MNAGNLRYTRCILIMQLCIFRCRRLYCPVAVRNTVHYTFIPDTRGTSEVKRVVLYRASQRFAPVLNSLDSGGSVSWLDGLNAVVCLLIISLINC